MAAVPVLIAIAGFLGAWLLVAGPVYQAAVELDSEQVDRAAFEAVDKAVPPSPRMSPWWWLLPPIAVARQRRATWRRREQMLRVMSTQQIDQLLSFGAKATGWLLVATGGACIATKETWELVELLEWPIAAFWVLVPVALVLSLLYAVARLHQDHRVLALKRTMQADDGVTDEA